MYFEFDESRRFHMPYIDETQRQSAWAPQPYNSLYLNWKRGAYCYMYAMTFIEPARHFQANVQLLNSYYKWPNTRTEYNIFFKEVFRMPNFWSELAKKMVFGTVYAMGDVGPKLAMWQYIFGGTNSIQEYSDQNSFKYFLCAMMAITPVAGTGIPFENARRAYYADKTWPIELRRNYTSPTNALLRIPFEEGPYYLMRGGFPLYASNWFFWVGYLTFYNRMKNWSFFMWLYNDFHYDFIKLMNMSISFSLAVILSYPMYYVREMVDLWPKERGGHCTWDNEYRKCARWMVDNVDQLGYNYYVNLTQWMRRYGALYFVTLWVADSMGMMSNSNEALWESAATNYGDVEGT